VKPINSFNLFEYFVNQFMETDCLTYIMLRKIGIINGTRVLYLLNCWLYYIANLVKEFSSESDFKELQAHTAFIILGSSWIFKKNYGRANLKIGECGS